MRRISVSNKVQPKLRTMNLHALRSTRIPVYLVFLALLPVASPIQAKATTACPQHFASGIAPALLNAKLRDQARPLCFQAYAVLHSGLTRAPLYSAEHLTRPSVAAAEAFDTRDNRFHAEQNLPTSERAELSDYKYSGYDRGHMVPSGDMGTKYSDHETFSLANIIPQTANLNRGSWAALERYVRALASQFGEAYVVTGPLYEGSSITALNGRVLVPTAVWKAIFVPGQGAGAWIATNEPRPSWQVVSLNGLARRTGIDPYPLLRTASKSKVPAFPTFVGRRPQYRLR